MTTQFNIFQNQLDKETRDELNRIGWDEAAEKFSSVRTHLEMTFRASADKFEPEMSSDYELVAQIEAEDLEDAFRISNLGNQEESVTRFAPMHSLSVGDVVENTYDGSFWLCCDVGFQEISAKFRKTEFRLTRPGRSEGTGGDFAVLVIQSPAAGAGSWVNLGTVRNWATGQFLEMIQAEAKRSSVVIVDAKDLIGRDFVTWQGYGADRVEILVKDDEDEIREHYPLEGYSVTPIQSGRELLGLGRLEANQIRRAVDEYVEDYRRGGFQVYVNDHSGIDWTVTPF
jgi:hypothetical protein